MASELVFVIRDDIFVNGVKFLSTNPILATKWSKGFHERINPHRIFCCFELRRLESTASLTTDTIHNGSRSWVKYFRRHSSVYRNMVSTEL